MQHAHAGARCAALALVSSHGGTYAVHGWMMTLTFDDGKTLRSSAVTSSDQPGGVLWLGGTPFSGST
jgi:hypothetical protein